MAVIFSKLCGKNEGFYKAVEGVLTSHIMDVDTGKTNDDAVLEAIFRVKKSKKFGERQGGMTEFGDFKEVEEGGVAPLDSVEEGFAKLIQHKAFSKSFVTTREMVDDSDIDEAKLAAANYVKAYKRSKLNFGTAFLTAEGSTFTYEGKSYERTTGDGKSMFATDHLGKLSGVASQSNIFTNELWDYDSSPNALMLNRLANIGRNIKNESGHIMGYTFDTVIIPGNCYLMEEGLNRIIGSAGVVGSANNDINTQKGKWTLIVNHRWEAAAGTSPYIIESSEANTALNALPFFNRVPLDIRNEVDLHTRNLVWNGWTRLSCGCFNWRPFIMGGASAGTTLT